MKLLGSLVALGLVGLALALSSGPLFALGLVSFMVTWGLTK